MRNTFHCVANYAAADDKLTQDDLRLLDRYRRSFSDAYVKVVSTIGSDLKLEPTGRPAKSTTSITEKLRRESIRLSQMQDIAGCRVIVSDAPTQETILSKFRTSFPHPVVVDRRVRPSRGDVHGGRYQVGQSVRPQTNAHRALCRNGGRPRGDDTLPRTHFGHNAHSNS